MNVISMRDFSKEQILAVLNAAEDVKAAMHGHDDSFRAKYSCSVSRLLEDLAVYNAFLENSTRTNYSFRAAAMRAGAMVDGFSSPADTSLKKGETFADTFIMLAGYGYNAIVMRSTEEGLPRWIDEALRANNEHLAKISSSLGIPYLSSPPMILNGGDGKNQHPTQGFLDLFTMRELAKSKGKELDGLEIALLNDLANGRTIASLISVAHHFNWNIHMAFPDRFGPRQSQLDDLAASNVHYTIHGENFMEAMAASFVAYHSRPQKERVAAGEDFARVKRIGQLTRDMFDRLGENAPYLMHPLPVDAITFEEIDHSLRGHPKNITPLQAMNGLYVRVALLALGLGRMAPETDLEHKAMETREFSLEELHITPNVKESSRMRSGYIDGDGVVIDHIQDGYGRRLQGALGLENKQIESNLAEHLTVEGGRKPRKDMLKLYGNYELNEEQLRAIALISPEATINYVSGGKVVRKFRPHIGNQVSGLIRCVNDACITNVKHEHVMTRHHILEGDDLRCHYCETPDTRTNVFKEQRYIYLR